MNFLERIRPQVEARVAAISASFSSSSSSSPSAAASIDTSIGGTARFEPVDFLKALKNSSAPKKIIAEVKRQSPSRGAFALELDPTRVAVAYANSGAAAISVLTEPHHFAGRLEDLAAIREVLPHAALLMKDFILDRRQIVQARNYGASAVLLIHAFLGAERTRELLLETEALGLRALVEVHDEAELTDSLDMGARLVAVNNRDLRTLKVDMNTAARLAPLLRLGAAQKDVFAVCASGLEDLTQLETLTRLGYHGFLMGTSLTQGGDPAGALSRLLGVSSCK